MTTTRFSTASDSNANFVASTVIRGLPGQGDRAVWDLARNIWLNDNAEGGRRTICGAFDAALQIAMGDDMTIEERYDRRHIAGGMWQRDPVDLARHMHIAPLDLTPVGLAEIAEALGVQRETVDQWRTRGLLPVPRWTVGGRPAWAWSDIETWARTTGRITE